MKRKNNSKGVITVFLILILVPMLLVTSIFVDASRFALARSLVTSVNDLTLNTAVSNYDVDLKEFYGLFGSVQKVDEFYDILEDYYSQMISQRGLGEDDAKSFAAAIIKSLKNSNNGQDLSNFLKMDIVEDVEIKPLDDGNLANPIILEQQIVDFMKYRSPINTGLSFITALQSFKTLDKQKKVVEDKNAYYEEVGSINSMLKNAWIEICNYSMGDYWKDGDYKFTPKSYEMLPGDYLTDLASSTGAFANYNISYKTSIQQFFKNVSGSKKYNVFYIYSDSMITNKTDPNPTKEKIIRAGEDFSKYWGICFDNSFLTDSGRYYEVNFYHLDGDYYPQIWLQSNYDGKYKSFHDAFINMLNAYNSFIEQKNGVNQLKDDNKDKESLMALCDRYDKDDNMSKQFMKVAGAFERMVEDLRPYYNSYLSSFNTAKSIIDQNNDGNKSITKISQEVSNIIQDLEEAKGYLEKAIAYLNEAKNADNSLKTLKDTWNESAKNVGQTTIGKESLAEIKGLNDEYVNSETIQEFITYLENIKNNINENIEQIKDYKFCGTSLKDIKSSIPENEGFSKLIIKNYGKSNLESLPRYKNDIETIAEDFYNNYYVKGKIDISWINSEYNPNLASTSNQSIKKFYLYLYNQFGDLKNYTDTTPEKSDEENSLSLNNIKKLGEGDKTSTNSGGASPSSEILSDSELLKSINSIGFNGANAGDGDTNSKLTSASLPSSGNLFTDLDSMSSQLRDNLYITDYVMSMFSYTTIESEFKDKNHSSEEDKIELKSLTLRDINADNNRLYPSEVEYIIFGNANSKTNYTLACTSVYAVRFLFNMIYAFTSSELKTEALPIAIAASAATLGVVPVSLFKAAILLVVTIIESGIDLHHLLNGESIPLFKTNKNWQTSFSNFVRNEIVDVAENIVEVASDSLVDLLNKTIDEIDQTATNKIDEVEAYLNRYFEQQIDNIAHGVTDVLFNEYDEIEKSIMMKYGEITSDAKNEIKQKLTNSLNEWSRQADTEIVKKVKETVVAKLIGILDEFINSKIKSPKSIISEEVEVIVGFVVDEVNNAVEECSNEVVEYKKKFVNNIKNAMGEGADKLKETINSSMRECFGGSSNNGVSNNVESLLSFRYSDYLRFFAICSIYTNEENFMLRIGTLIQANMNKASNDDKKDFSLSKANAYITVNSTVKVKPLLINLSFFDEMITVNDDGSWGKYTFKNTKGY